MADFTSDNLPNGSPRVMSDYPDSMFTDFVGLTRTGGGISIGTTGAGNMIMGTAGTTSRDTLEWGYDVPLNAAAAAAPVDAAETPSAAAAAATAPVDAAETPSDSEFEEGARPDTAKAAAVDPEPGGAIETFAVGSADEDLLVLNALCMKSKLFTARLRATIGAAIAEPDPELAIIDLDDVAATVDAVDLRVDIGERIRFTVGATQIMEADYIRIGRFGDVPTQAGTRFVFSWEPATRVRMLAAATPHKVARGEAAESESAMFITRVLAHVAEELGIEHVYQSCDESGVFTVLGLTNISWRPNPEA